MSRLTVTDHCVERFVERTTQGKKGVISEYKASKTRARILEMVRKSTQVELKSGYRVNNIIKNDMRNSVFLRYSDWIFVLDPRVTTVITCYPSSSLRWCVVGPQASAGKVLFGL